MWVGFARFDRLGTGSTRVFEVESAEVNAVSGLR